MPFFAELKRRNVFRVAIAYLAGSWLLVEVSETLFPVYGLSDAAIRLVVTVLAIGFPLLLIFSWVFELTPEGLMLEKDIDPSVSVTHHTGKKLDRVIIVLLALALGYFAFDKFVLEPARVSDLVEETAQQARSEALVESYGDKSIAVLPFVNMSADPEQEYFSDGISEELLNLLAQIAELRVISRSSAFSFKGKDIPIPTVAQQLNVAHVLEGSVRKVDNRVRIKAQLIEARSDSHLWSQSYDRELNDIFAVQDEIAAAISDALKVKLVLDSTSGEAIQPTAIKAANTDAYDAYLRGRELIGHRNKESLEEAVRHLERSLRLDNNFAPAYAQLAIATTLLPRYGGYHQQESNRTAMAHLDRAQELEPDLAEAHAGRAMLAILANDPASTIEHARKALASNPSYIDAMNWMNIGLEDLGRYEEVDANYELMLTMDPLMIMGRYNYAAHLAEKGQIEQAHGFADQLLAQSPMYGYLSHADTSLLFEGRIADSLSWALRARTSSIYLFVAFDSVGEYNEARRSRAARAHWLLLSEKRYDEAIQAMRVIMSEDPDSPPVITEFAWVLYLAGRVDEALPYFEQALDFVPQGRPISHPMSLPLTMGLALARRKAEDEQSAQAAAGIVRQDLAARRAAGQKNQNLNLTEAMIAAFEHDPDGVITALNSAIQGGLRKVEVFDYPIFEEMRDEPRFVALQQELEAILAVEHDKLLQLICFNNPVPDDWRPMPETCEGVVEQ